MRTRCPACQTNFRVTPEQLKLRAGKVRCGQCRTVFNALDGLFDEGAASTSLHPQVKLPKPPEPAQVEGDHDIAAQSGAIPADPELQPGTTGETTQEQVEEASSVTESETQTHELGRAAGLVLPRETAEIPGYSKWSEGSMFGPELPPSEKAARWPFALASLLLILALVGQLVFRFRSEIAITSPSLRPMLAEFSDAFGATLPLPRHVELVSIENSDLQTDPSHGNLLLLNATLRNRANYEQDFPALELSLTDTQDAAIARRVLLPYEYLPIKISAEQPFAPSSEVVLRLWIDAKEIGAAGYRLYVFYP